jgi:hypothetical protein
MAKLASNMPAKFAVPFRACCVAVALLMATAQLLAAADAKQTPLVGATRDQVLAQLGEPKNTIVAGNREVLLFDHDRVTLRDNVVVSVERIFNEPVRRPPPPPPVSAPATPAAEQTTGETPAPPPSKTTAAVEPAAPARTAAKESAPTTAAPTTAATVTTPPPADPNAPLEIKVRSPGSARVQPKADTPSTSTPIPSSTAAKTTTPAPAKPVATTNEQSAAPTATSGSSTAAPTTLAATSTPTKPVAANAAPSPAPATSADSAAKAESTPTTAASPDSAKSADATGTAPGDKKQKAKTRRVRRADTDIEEDEPTSYFTPSTYVIAAVTIAAGIGFLVWRSRQRQLELAATAVSRTPFSAPVAAGGGGAVFKADLLAKLEWKRFEELVASYYTKTGVVAARTKTGPASPVHIKISWKGEPRPFALVQCIAHPTGLIEVKPLQDLMTVLNAEDIRRGYVVTTGKFNVPARDFAEEKHITLLPGDIFLEKINALPEAARNELMTEITTGDYTTPSCPKCEAKMVKDPADPSRWHCVAHPDQTLPVK